MLFCCCLSSQFESLVPNTFRYRYSKTFLSLFIVRNWPKDISWGQVVDSLKGPCRLVIYSHVVSLGMFLFSIVIFAFRFLWEKKGFSVAHVRASSGTIGTCSLGRQVQVAVQVSDVWGSSVDLLGNNVQDHVLVPPPHHRPQLAVALDGGAHVAGGRDPLPVDADDDVTLLEAGAGRKQ